jgi:hypothetical protein
VASLYSLGPAYTVAPAAVEKFLAANWPVISTLMTDHGPWEGYNATRKKPIEFQTTAHTLGLALGLLGNGSDHMKRYLDSRGLGQKLAEVYRPGPAADLLAEGGNVFAWAVNDRPLRSTRQKDGFRVTGDRVGEVGIAFTAAAKDGVDLSGDVLTVRYKWTGPAAPVIIALKPPKPVSAAVIPTEVFARFADTGGKEAEIRVPLPATPGLTRIKEVVLTVDRGAGERAVDLTVTRAASTPPGGR